MTYSTAYSEYVPTWERPVITALLNALLEAGKTLTINDGEEDILTSDKLTELRPALGGTGEDYIKFDDGYFYLIYNNGSKGTPMIVITDYAGNEVCDKIWADLRKKYDT